MNFKISRKRERTNLAPTKMMNEPGSADSIAPRKSSTSKRPKYSRFSQQEFSACKPILTPKWVILSFLLVGFIFIPIGIFSLNASQHVVEIINEYDSECIPLEFKTKEVEFIKSSLNKNCSRTLNITKDMKKPIYVYYELDKFYQNHRRYVTSRSDLQLRIPGFEGNIRVCYPEEKRASGPVVPCGLIAWSLFNDTYAFSRNNQQLTVNKRGISWESDRDRKFGKDIYPKNSQTGNLIGGGKLDTSIPLSEQEDLIVWMRTSALPTFRKLYGIIEDDLNNGDVINVSLQNNYNTYSFHGKKKLVLSTSSWLGGKNDFIGIAYITMGGLSLFLATLFMLMYHFNPRQLGDPSRLSWNRSPDGH